MPDHVHHVFHSSPTGVIFCAHMLTTGKLQMKGQQCKKNKQKTHTLTHTHTQQQHSQNDNLDHLHHFVVKAALFKCQRGIPVNSPSQPPTVPAKIRQIKLYYSRQSCSWSLKWFYVNYPNGFALKATVFLIYSQKKALLARFEEFFLSFSLPHITQKKMFECTETN